MPFDEQEQDSTPPPTDPSTAPSIHRHPVDSAALSRDRLTRELVLAVLHGMVFNKSYIQEIVDDCREMSRYIQETNEVTDWWVYPLN